MRLSFKRRKYRGKQSMVNRRFRLVCQNANPENANRYTPLRWAKVFTEQVDRLLPK